jgi:hypothetical protein
MGWFGGFTLETYNKGPGTYEVLAVGAPAVGFSISKYNPTTGPYAKMYAQAVLLSVEDGDLRFRLDGGNPTSTDGHQMNNGDNVILTGTQAIKQFRAAMTGDTNATLRVTYFF